MKLLISTKMAAGFAVMLALIAAVGFFGWQSTANLSAHSKEMFTKMYRHTAYLDLAEDAVWRLRYGFTQFMVVNNPEDRRKIVEDEPRLYAIVKKNMDAYENDVITAEERAALEEWNESWNKYYQARPRWFELYGAGKLQEAAEWRARTTTPFGLAAVNALDEVMDVQRTAAARTYSAEMAAARSSASVLLAMLTVLALAVGGGIALILRFLPMQALAQSEERFHAIARSAMDGIVLVDGANLITYWNDSARAIFRADVGTVPPAPTFLSLLPPGGAAEYQQALALCGAAGAGAEPARLLQIVGRRSDGSDVPIELSISPWQEGADTAYLHVVRDVTERMDADRTVRDLVEHYRLLFDGSPLPMWIVEPETVRFLAVNDAAVRHYGYTRPEFLAMTLRDLRPPEDVAAFDASIRERPLSGYRVADISRHRKKDGTVIYVESTGDSAVLNGRPVRLIAINDVTERRRAEEELGRQREAAMLREKLAAMGGLLAGVAHELNNPLSVVIGNALLLQNEVKAGPLAKRGERIVNAAQRCGRIVKNFLALARHQPRQVQAVDLNAAVQGAVEIVAYALRVDGVAVEYDLDPAMPAVWADAHELGQVVVNLIVNAQQAMHEVPLPRRLMLVSRYDHERGRAQLRVSDTGPGIPLEIQQRIFEPLFTTKPPGQGTGLGLSICTAIVERHGGSLRVESAPGRGTTFTMDVPIGTPPASSAAGAPEDVASVQASAILVVDDEAEVGDLVRDVLSNDGHRVDVVTNGVKALECLKQRAYDVIISDMRMPELDGPGLYRAVQRWRPALCARFVFMTGDSLGPETTAFLETVRTLPKPFLPDEVREAVGRVLTAAPAARPEVSAADV